MNDFIVLLVGRSGSGKSSVAQELEEHFGWKQLRSYTTRPKRSEDEDGHTFISDEEFDKLTGLCAYTRFDKHRYCATESQVNEAKVYVIDPAGVDYFKNHYNGDKLIIPICLLADESTLYKRMRKRGDSWLSAIRRVRHDRKAFEDFELSAPIVINAEVDLPYVVANIYKVVNSVAAIHRQVKDKDGEVVQ